MYTGLLGILIFIGLAYLLSTNRKAVKWRTVLGALSVQVGFAILVLYIPVGQSALAAISDAMSQLLAYSNEGITFIFGDIGNFKMGFIFAFHVLPVIVFFSAFIAVLYYLGIMGWIIRCIGGGIQKVLQTSRSESLSATANIFVGQTEAPLVIRPFVNKMTKSELFAVMAGGLASVSGSILAGLAGVGIDMQYLIAASFMAAPGGLLMAKLLVPEEEEPNENLTETMEQIDKPVNVIDAAAAGASSGLQLAMNVGAMLLAFVGLIALINGLLGWSGSLVGLDDLSLQMMLGFLFQPVAFILGIPWAEAQLAGSFIGQKIVVNEFVAYLDFVNYKDQLSHQSQAIITFALCGFANLGSIAVLLGGLGSMAPDRRGEIAKMGFKAVLAGSLSNFTSAAIAGVLIAIQL